MGSLAIDAQIVRLRTSEVYHLRFSRRSGKARFGFQGSGGRGFALRSPVVSVGHHVVPEKFEKNHRQKHARRVRRDFLYASYRR